MRLSAALCLFFITVACLSLITVSATPVTPKQEVLQQKKSTCATIETYTVRWFVDNALNAKRPPSSSCLFYTWGQTRKAQEYAEKHNKTTIWVSRTTNPLSRRTDVNKPRTSGPKATTTTTPMMIPTSSATS